MATELAEQLEALHLNGDNGPSAESSEGSLHQRIRLLSRDISRLLDSLYEVQELRHGATDADRLNALVSAADAAVPLLPDRLEDIKRDVHEDKSEQLQADFEAASDDMGELSRQYADLKREIKEDAWLARFESTASQADGMLGPLSDSLMECSRYIETIASSPVPVSLSSDLPELPSYDKLDTLVERHMQMRQAYASSLEKILRIMGKSLNERATRNGVMVRRIDDIEKRWRDLQRDLIQLDSRLRIMRSQQAEASNDMEILTSPTTAPGNFFPPAGPTHSHRSSFSSSEASRSSAKPTLDTGISPAPAPLRRKSSFMSATSSSTARTVERVASSAIKTPAKSRISSINRAASPASSAASLSSYSRIPVASPVPRLSLSKSRSTSEGQEALLTPSRPRPSGGFSAMTAPRASLTPSLPKSAMALRPRGPPSAYRSMTPTPGGRPSSRLSMVSHAPSAVAPVNLQPFRPSQYDLLDTHVQAVINEVGFKLFVARVDPAMKRGQRRGDNEEWKGEFVFGAGQRTSGVKLLKLAGRTGHDGPRMKCLVRVQGAWHDLATVLRKRQEDSAAE